MRLPWFISPAYDREYKARVAKEEAFWKTLEGKRFNGKMTPSQLITELNAMNDELQKLLEKTK